MKKFFKSFNLFEIIFFAVSVSAILISFFACGNTEYLYFATSLIGACMLILMAKGNFVGQILGIVFAVLYAVISWSYKYYGEMATYLFMSLPSCAVALISWLKNPSSKGREEVKVNKISVKEYFFMAGLTAAVTTGFYFLLGALNTNNLIISTVSVLTSFAASYLQFRRCRFYALAYTANDIILITLWSLASVEQPDYIAMVVCFSVFLANDIYGFINWTRMLKRQSAAEPSEQL